MLKPMSIRILYFAALADRLGVRSEHVELPPDIASVDRLRTHLAARGGVWADLGSFPKLRAAVNQRMAGGDAPIQAGDEVAFFPPVTGG